MEADPDDYSVEQLEPRQSPGDRARLEQLKHRANELKSKRLNEMTFTLFAKSLSRLACREGVVPKS